MAHDVFISYSSKDKVIANAVCAELEKQRIRCWIAPRDIMASRPYPAEIIRGINASRVLVLVLTSNSNSSPMVMREVERAVSHGIPIIPFRVEDITPSVSLEFFLGSIHWLDAISPPMERHLQSLAKLIEQILLTKDDGRDESENSTQGSESPPPEPGSKLTKGSSKWRSFILIAISLFVGVSSAMYFFQGPKPVAESSKPIDSPTILAAPASAPPPAPLYESEQNLPAEQYPVTVMVRETKIEYKEVDGKRIPFTVEVMVPVTEMRTRKK